MVAALVGARLVRDPALLERALLTRQRFSDDLEASGVAFVHCRCPKVEGLLVLLATIDYPLWDTVAHREIDQVFMVIADEGSVLSSSTMVELARLAGEMSGRVGRVGS